MSDGGVIGNWPGIDGTPRRAVGLVGVNDAAVAEALAARVSTR